ncbi:MAG: M67 family metallopeptidase [Ruminococcus sp.]|nr:M67 family metallopeptidase [Ruminococcus sp.]
MKITLKRADYEKLLAHAKSCLPEEACGLIGGTKDEDAKHIEEVYLLKNTDHSNEHFTLDPKEQLAAIKDMRSKGLVPLGNWHSHPESPSRPSEEDKRLSFDSTASYMILSLMVPDEPVLNSFHVEDRRDVTKEELVIID